MEDEAYDRLPSLSIDVGIMEKSAKVATVPRLFRLERSG
jgi:mannose-1-phosphate guanylyltransferase